jgi:hypothetical protein
MLVCDIAARKNALIVICYLVWCRVTYKASRTNRMGKLTASAWSIGGSMWGPVRIGQRVMQMATDIVYGGGGSRLVTLPRPAGLSAG